MVIGLDKLTSLILFAVVATVSSICFPVGDLAASLAISMVICAPGLVLIWFPEPLSEAACTSHGVIHAAPVGLISSFGWLFLIGYPILLASVIA